MDDMGSELKHMPPILWILCEKVFIYACKTVENQAK